MNDELNFRNIDFSLFFKANLFLTTTLFLFFLSYNENYTFFNFLLLFLATVSSSIVLYVFIYIALFIFKLTNKFIMYLASFVFMFVNIGLVVDFFIFRVYKFHINAMVLNIMLSPDAMDSIQIGFFPILVFVLVVLGFFFFEVILIRKLFEGYLYKKERLNDSLNRLIVIPSILIVLSDKISYGLVSLLNKNDIMVKYKVIPLYAPVTFNRLAAKLFDYKPDVKVQNTIKKDATLKYPLKEIEISDSPNKINIFIIASDSARNSSMNSEITPNIEEFKKDALVFQNHHTGGNATRFGIFSLMYGVNSTYWFNFLSAAKGSILFDVLKDLDYDINIISSTNTNWPEFRKTCYVNALDCIKDDFEGEPWEKDRASSDYFIKKFDSYSSEKPVFSFIFLDSPHGYSFPPQYNKFKASDENVNYLTVNKDGRDIKNVFARYKNSLYYNDALFKEMIDKLKEKNLYDNSLIIFTGDHGEEFYENGFFGHNSAFSKPQTNVPFIVKLPKNMDSIEDLDLSMLTSHADVVPTLLSLIGVKNDTSDYSNGYNIFDKKFKREYVFSANWNNNAIITNDEIYVFSNLPNKMFSNEVRDSKNYKEIDKQVKSKYLLDVISENSKFLE